MSAFEPIPIKGRKYANAPPKVKRVTTKHLDAIVTEPMDGHVSLDYGKKKLKSIFQEPVDVLDLILDEIPSKDAGKVPMISNRANEADWDEIKAGEWPIEKMASLIFINDLPQPASKTKESYIRYLKENRKHIL